MAERVVELTIGNGLRVLPNDTYIFGNSPEGIVGYDIFGTAIGNGYTLLRGDVNYALAIVTTIQGQSLQQFVNGGYDINVPNRFGGQVTPVTGYLTTASDDSWEMRNQPTALYGQYQLTTQVPTQNLPLMTHVYCRGDNAGVKFGIWKVAYVIDSTRVVVYDPKGQAVGYWGEDFLYASCQNIQSAKNVNLQAPAAATMLIITTLGIYEVIYGPFNIDFGPNQNGIVEPFAVIVQLNTVKATITY